MPPGVAYVLAFALLMNYFAYLALKFYSGQQPRASVSGRWAAWALKHPYRRSIQHQGRLLLLVLFWFI